MARAAGQPSEVHSILDIFLNIGLGWLPSQWRYGREEFLEIFTALGMILALVREVPVEIPDEPASLFGYSFLEQYPSILPSLANRTPLSSKTSTVSAHFEVCFSPILVPRLHFKLGRLLNSVA
ncbi:hypothetical protein G5714_011593 [Onychostoma macrolepis]|uniref:Uncharacterized protein n=1 Tax=Onychostoma macrolepis TaxID=369639 RepID=A0A7J6CIV9_9TELE|nr:hypothetical protein G5714_011593 [Onychostoma macrolepis]